MDPKALIDHAWMCSRAGDRVRRLLACACCRRAWHLFDDEKCRRAVEVAEQYADGLADADDLADAEEGVQELGKQIGFNAVVMVAFLVVHPRAAHGPREAIGLLPWMASPEERAGQAGLLRDLLGPWPFRAPALDPTVLAWNGGVVLSLAQAAYEDRQLPSGHLDRDRLLILADALEEAGAGAEVLAHLRSPGPHVRGCWAVDLVLGRG
jgi:hypothetical protein